MKTRQFTEDQIIRLLQEGKKGEKSVEDLCRDFGCSTASYYTWKKKYGDTNVSYLYAACNAALDART